MSFSGLLIPSLPNDYFPLTCGVTKIFSCAIQNEIEIADDIQEFAADRDEQ
jgi:hypothetical protein